jgi:hypothetical protein
VGRKNMNNKLTKWWSNRKIWKTKVQSIKTTHCSLSVFHWHQG